MMKKFKTFLFAGALLLCLLPLTAQDTLVTVTQDTLLVFVENLNNETIRYRRFGDEKELMREAKMQQIAAIFYQDKESNPDYIANETLLGSPMPEADTSRLSIITTVDGNTYVGKVLSTEGGTVKVETQLVGIVNIPKGNIDKIELVSSDTPMIDGKLWRTNRFAARYFISPSGYGLRSGEGNYQNNLIFLNQVDIGVTDNISVGFGVFPAFLFGGAPTPVWIYPKISVPVIKDRLNLGGSALVGTVLGGQVDAGGFGFLIGTGTYGSKDRNVSFGLGYGYAGGGFAQTPAIILSGMYRLGEKGYFVTDNFIFSTADTTNGIIMLGGRTVWPSITLSYGGGVPFGDFSDLFIFPWLGVSLPFGS